MVVTLTMADPRPTHGLTLLDWVPVEVLAARPTARGWATDVELLDPSRGEEFEALRRRYGAPEPRRLLALD